MTVRILQGDCRDVLRTLPDASIDACVTDPPYDLTSKPGGGPHGKGLDTPYARARAGAVPGGFMGMKWDGTGVAFDHATWREVFRVLKPGAHLVAFGGTRTYHRMVCAIEDAGFEIRDQIGWLYGSGFPKSFDVSKAIDKAARGVPQGGSDPTSRNHGRFKGGRSDDNPSGRGFGAGPGAFMLEAGERHGARRELVAEAQRWQGWGTALKPAWEPIVLARKPLVGTVAANVLEHGTGAINVDACRVDGGARPWRDLRDNGDRLFDGGIRQGSQVAPDTTLGRWPANIVHDGSEDVLQAFPEASGAVARDTGHEPTGHGFRGNVYGAPGKQGRQPSDRRDGGGSAARFFYCAKADRNDRNDGLDGMPARVVGVWGGDEDDLSEGKKTTIPRRNHHPTVKPTDLMRWLCRLVTPPGGTILDPFTGSGSTLKAAELEGFNAIGIELSADYIDIARRRIAADAPLFAEVAA